LKTPLRNELDGGGPRVSRSLRGGKKYTNNEVMPKKEGGFEKGTVPDVNETVQER